MCDFESGKLIFQEGKIPVEVVTCAGESYYTTYVGNFPYFPHKNFPIYTFWIIASGCGLVTVKDGAILQDVQYYVFR